MAFSSTLSSFARPNPTDRLNSPSHSALHNTVSSALGQVEAIIGVRGDSSVVGTINTALFSPGSDGGGHVQSANKGGTGQTSYTKGDILIASSTSVLTKLAVGANGAILQANSAAPTGVNWKAGQVTISSFLTTSLWTKPTGLSYIQIQLWGAGGSGGVHTTTRGGGGGGGGGFNQGTFMASALGATEQVNIGVGGASVASGNGNVGGNTVFGASSFLTAFGGGAGGGGSTSGGGGGGGGGAISAGQNGASSVPGIGGKPTVLPGSENSAGPGAREQDNSSGGGGGAFGASSNSGGDSAFGGGGGGGGGNASAANGGNALWGGGGGAPGVSSGSTGTVGTSKFGGNGGSGGVGGAGGRGSVAGGGGGGGFNAISGSGGNGKVIIYEYY